MQSFESPWENESAMSCVWTTWRSAVTPIKASTLHILKVEIDPRPLPVVGSLVVSIFVPDTLDPGSTPPRRIIC